MGLYSWINRYRRASQPHLLSPLLGSEAGSDSERSFQSRDSDEDEKRYRRRSSTATFYRAHSLLPRTRALLVLLVAFSFSCLVLLGIATTGQGQTISILQAALQSALQKTLSPSHKVPLEQAGLDRSWDYYAQRGIFVEDRTSETLPPAQRARFVPVSHIESFAATGENGLNASVTLGDGFDEIVQYSQAVERGNKQGFEDLAYLQNKTVLLIGDSIDRFSLDFMCQQMLPRTFLSYNQLHRPPHDLSWIQNFDGLDEFSEPHKCLYPTEYFTNTSIWSLMLYGVTSGPDEWNHKEMTLEPRQYDDKIKLFAESFAKLGHKPDLIIVNTVLWDLATANLRDAKAETPNQELLDFKFLNEFRQKTIKLMDLVSEIWPDAAKMYRPNHGMRHNSEGIWFMSGLNPMPKAIHRTPYAPNKVLQLNEIVDDILASQTTSGSRRPYWPFDLRHATQEFINDFPDEVHTGDVGRAIYGQMLMYYLKMLT